MRSTDGQCTCQEASTRDNCGFHSHNCFFQGLTAEKIAKGRYTGCVYSKLIRRMYLRYYFSFCHLWKNTQTLVISRLKNWGETNYLRRMTRQLCNFITLPIIYFTYSSVSTLHYHPHNHSTLSDLMTFHDLFYFSFCNACVIAFSFSILNLLHRTYCTELCLLTI